MQTMNDTKREQRTWWVVNDGRVVEAVGYDCGDQAGSSSRYWWFPTLGFSAGEGHHVFASRVDAVTKALVELRAERASIDAKIAALEARR